MTIHVMHLELGRQLYGGAKQVEYLLQALNNQKIQNTLICPEDSAIAQVAFERSRVVPVDYAGDMDFRFPFRLSQIIRQYQPDILHVHSRRGADVWGGIVARMTGIPAICTRRVDNPEGKSARWKYRQYSAVVSISHGVQNVVGQHCKGLPQHVIHSAVDMNDFTFPEDRNWFRKKFAIPEHHKVIANFAQLIPRKGQADIIAAMRDVLKAEPDVTCLLFGKGKQRDNYQALIDQFGIGEHVRLCGFTEEVSRILPNIDFMVHPAYAEGLGIILLQGASCGKGLISCPVGGIPEIITHEKTGLLIEPGNVNALSTAILRLLHNPVEAKQLGEAARMHVAAHFTPSAMAKRYEALYRDLVNGQAADL